MEDVVLSVFIIGSKNKKLNNVPRNVEIIKYSDVLDLFNAKGKYIVFIDSQDKISDNYFECILNKINEDDFDSCFINYSINYDYEREPKVRNTKSELDVIFPIKNSYIWSYVFKKETFLKLYIIADKEDFNDLLVQLFNKRTSITDVIYFHDKDGEKINIFNMVNRKDPIMRKNIIYMGDFCNGTFNGYITWLLEIGKRFSEYPITIMYTKITDITKNRFEKYFECIQFDPGFDYLCDNLLVTYSTYFFPINIHSLKQSCMFIHGNMSDNKNAVVFTDDIYDKYIAVSKVASEKAVGYFPTEKIEYINNPFTYDKDVIKPNLFLISALRNAREKGIDRIKKAASILDEEGIPYMWTVFTDVPEASKGGLIFRNSVTNIIDYLPRNDYLVQFSESESLSYSMTEALCSGVKVISTDLPAIHELGVEDGVNGFLIPLHYFDDGKETLLKGKLLLAYKNKDLKFEFNYDYERFKEYENIFNK